MADLNEITEKIIEGAIRAYHQLGPGFLEHLYEEALGVEFELQALGYQRQVLVPVVYIGRE